MLNLGEEQTIRTEDGREWTLGRLELGLVRAFREWIKAQLGDPFSTVERFLGKVEDELLMPMLKEAEEAKRELQSFSLASPLAARFLSTEEGMAKLVSLLLKKHHGGHTEEDAFSVASVFAKDAGDRLQKAMGQAPNAEAPAVAPEG